MIRKTSFWAVTLAVCIGITSLVTDDAHAQSKRRQKRQKATVTSKANVEALRELMGAFKFGMSYDQVIEVLTRQISERYAEQVAATSDVYQQDALRKKRNKEIKELRSSLVEFNGKKGGWDVSIIDDQFAHNTEESMMVQWETHQGRNQRRFFFFFEGRLYKMFIALDTSALGDEQRNFAFFRSLMETRFGQGEIHATGMSWRLRDIHVDALDKLSFYNAFCLITTDPRMAAQVQALRKERAEAPRGRNAIIEAITGGKEDSTPSLDERSNVINSILNEKKKKKK